ncbi:MAG TPA: ACP S-malonyltransferase [Actinophytocola sp.]|jgi:malonyl CoA-acyl carrier protein transacylase|uniref:ACP S-malonyltransferase n=1 Tax=Actinophytocola sp. TaxID=1872138 RepID=UPI002DF761D8|nr:ACP S-malonyltransferase [Actinophytocola sp.]
MNGLIFPGQGSQRPGMGADLFDQFPEVVAEADRVLGYPVARLCREDPDGRLAQTRYAQPAIFLVNALTAMRLTADGASFTHAAGHSLGEYNALVAAGLLDLMTALTIVKRRAIVMSPIGGGMAAVVGAPTADVASALRGSGLSQVFIANRNSDRQTVIAGNSEQLVLAGRLLTRRMPVVVTPLKTSGPFHTPLMAPAATAFRGFLNQNQLQLKPEQLPVISSVTGERFNPEHAVDLLSRQISTPVEWVRTIHTMRAAGVTSFIEVNGTALTSLISEIGGQA